MTVQQPSSPPLVQIGALYLKAGILPLAEASYRRALEIAHGEDDAYTQATALMGLGQVAYAARSNAEAGEYLRQALDLYHKLGEAGQVQAADSLLAEIK